MIYKLHGGDPSHSDNENAFENKEPKSHLINDDHFSHLALFSSETVGLLGKGLPGEVSLNAVLNVLNAEQSRPAISTGE